MENNAIVWKYLYGKLKNPYGAAALMGNLFAESSLNPINANGVKKLGLTNTQYTAMTDNGENDFVNDGIAYGLVQWCHHGRKQRLLDFAKAHNKSVGDINLQLDYLWEELQKYKTVMKALIEATNIKDASDVVLLKYEKPANQSDSIKLKRASYGQRYYDMFCPKEETRISFNISKINAKELYENLRKSLE